MSLRRRLALLLVAYVLVVGLGGALALWALERDERLTGDEVALADAQTQVEALVAAWVDCETGMRGYVLTGIAEFLEPFESCGPRIERLDAALDSTLQAWPELAAAVDAIGQRGAAWRAEFAEPFVELRRAGIVRAVEQAEAARRAFDAIRAAADAARDEIRSERAVTRDELDTVDRLLGWLVAGNLVLAVVLALGAAALLRRWVTGPLRALGESIAAAERDDRSPPIAVGGPPELAAVGDEIERLRLALRRRTVEAEQAREAIEQRAEIVRELRSQLEGDLDDLPRGWTAAGEIRAAEGIVAGDAYDVVQTRGHLSIVVIDISGHGAMSAITALRCKELVTAALRSGMDPGEAFAWIAEQLGPTDTEFLTAFAATVELDTGALTYANAGHPPAFLARDGGSIDELPPTGPIIGPFRGAWSSARDRLEEGDTLAVYSDGIVEARDRAGELFGAERLAELLAGAACDEAPAIVQRCLDAVERWETPRLRDDATVVLVCRRAVPPEADGGPGEAS